MKRFSILLSLVVLAMTFLLLSLPAQAASSVHASVAAVTKPTNGQSFKIRGYDSYPYYYGTVTVPFESNTHKVYITGGDPNTDYHVNFSHVLSWHYQSSGIKDVDTDSATNVTARCNATGYWEHLAKGSGTLSGSDGFYQTGGYDASATNNIINTVSGQSATGGSGILFSVTN